MELNDISSRIICSSIKVHKTLGPGLLDSAYEACQLYELHKDGLKVESQVGLPINYNGVALDVGYRVDILVEGSIIVELKSVEKILPIHEAQLISYLRLSGKKLGLIINFNVLMLKDGIKRMVNNL
jgi:GxxExxY protein